MNRELEAMEASIEAAKRQVELGKAMQARGLAVFNSIAKDGNQEGQAKQKSSELARLLSSASSAIEKGARLERDAYSALRHLEEERHLLLRRQAGTF